MAFGVPDCLPESLRYWSFGQRGDRDEKQTASASQQSQSETRDKRVRGCVTVQFSGKRTYTEYYGYPNGDECRNLKAKITGGNRDVMSELDYRRGPGRIQQ